MKIGFGIGLSITTSAIMLGHVSGGHLNPAVSLGAIFAGRMSVVRGLLYVPAQIIGGKKIRKRFFLNNIFISNIRL